MNVGYFSGRAQGKTLFATLIQSRTTKQDGPPPLGPSPGKHLVDAILANSVGDVSQLLQHEGADPNATLVGLMKFSDDASSSSSLQQSSNTTPERWTRSAIFCGKRLFGEAPTPVHVAVLDVYHRNRYRQELERAFQILKLLLEMQSQYFISSTFAASSH